MPLPLLYVKAEICRLFGIGPSQFDEEPIEIIRMAKLLAIADKVRYGGKGQG